jgi:hypothetical protein
MKILNDIACNLNWNLIQLRSYWNLINGMQIGAKGFENFLWSWNLKKNKNKNEKPPFHAFVFGNQQNRFQSCGQLMESKAT